MSRRPHTILRILQVAVEGLPGFRVSMQSRRLKDTWALLGSAPRSFRSARGGDTEEVRSLQVLGAAWVQLAGQPGVMSSQSLQHMPQSSQKVRDRGFQGRAFGEMHCRTLNPTASSPSRFALSLPRDREAPACTSVQAERVTWRALCVYPALWESAAWCLTLPAKLRMEECAA